MSLFSLLTPGYPFSLGTQDYSSLRSGLELLNILSWFFNFLTFCLLFIISVFLLTLWAITDSLNVFHFGCHVLIFE